MKRMAILIAVIAMTLCSIATAVGQKASQATTALRTADQQWARVFGAGDLKRSVDFCTENGSIMPPNGPIATGRRAISELFTAFFAIPEFKITWHANVVEVARSGEIGYTTGVYEMTFKARNGSTIEDHGKYVTVWQRQRDGSWKVSKDIFNSDVPLPEAP